MSLHKKLYRARGDRMIAGVCAGLAKYFGQDVVVVRITAMLLFFLGIAPAVLAYIILWAVVPEEPRRIAADKKQKQA